MKNRNAFITLVVLIVLAGLAIGGAGAEPDTSGQIYLYGENHGVEEILEKEVAIWKGYYDGANMRHLFVELPYYTATFLNMWMQADTDDILDALYDDWEGTAAHVPATLAFYKQLKAQCPETVFHGTDVGHQYNTTGARYLAHLEEAGMVDSAPYQQAQQVIEQGACYYKNYENKDHVYRENMMAENFIREFDKLNGESVMGIYGSAHVWPDDKDYTTHTVPSMAGQLKARYGDVIHAVNVWAITDDIGPEKDDIITVGGKAYQATYFGKQDLTGFKDFAYREFWRIEDAYQDFKDAPATGETLPYNNYPMEIDVGQIFAIDFTMVDGSTERRYYRSDGNMWEGLITTEGFAAD